jgi:hypothetical protein
VLQVLGGAVTGGGPEPTHPVDQCLADLGHVRDLRAGRELGNVGGGGDHDGRSAGGGLRGTLHLPGECDHTGAGGNRDGLFDGLDDLALDDLALRLLFLFLLFLFVALLFLAFLFGRGLGALRVGGEAGAEGGGALGEFLGGGHPGVLLRDDGVEVVGEAFGFVDLRLRRCVEFGQRSERGPYLSGVLGQSSVVEAGEVQVEVHEWLLGSDWSLGATRTRRHRAPRPPGRESGVTVPPQEQTRL